MLSQNFVQKHQLKIHSQQLQMLQLFHLTTIQMEQRMLTELEENPFLEETPSYEEEVKDNVKEDVQDYQDWEEYAYDNFPDRSKGDHLWQSSSYEKPATNGEDFRSELYNQLSFLPITQEEYLLGEFIIHSLTDEGFLKETAQEVADDYSLRYLQMIEVSTVQNVIAHIRGFEPAGVATASIQECLLEQLRRMDENNREVRLATRIIRDLYKELKTRSFEKIMNELGITDEELKLTLGLLAALKLKPVCGEDQVPVELITVIPDFVVVRQSNTLQVLSNERTSRVKLTNWDTTSRSSDVAMNRFMSKKYDEARWFVNAIKQREQTMMKVMNAIVKVQHEYFMTGDELTLKPMILKHIAEIVGVDISTVSRITCNKYVQTAFGNILIKNLFNKGLSTQMGEAVGVPNVKKAIMQVITKENKDAPYTDQEIVKQLAVNGLSIARRTVAKYRHELHIPAAQVRSSSPF